LNGPPVETALPPRRTERELLEELVDIARATKANQGVEQRCKELAAEMAEMRARHSHEIREARRAVVEEAQAKFAEEFRKELEATRQSMLSGKPRPKPDSK